MNFLLPPSFGILLVEPRGGGRAARRVGLTRGDRLEASRPILLGKPSGEVDDSEKNFSRLAP